MCRIQYMWFVTNDFFLPLMERYTVYETDNKAFQFLNIKFPCKRFCPISERKRERERDYKWEPHIFPRDPLTNPYYLPWPVCQISQYICSVVLEQKVVGFNQRRSSVPFDQCTMTIHDVQKPNVLTLLAFKDHPIATGIKSITRSL